MGRRETLRTLHTLVQSTILSTTLITLPALKPVLLRRLWGNYSLLPPSLFIPWPPLLLHVPGHLFSSVLYPLIPIPISFPPVLVCRPPAFSGSHRSITSIIPSLRRCISMSTDYDQSFCFYHWQNPFSPLTSGKVMAHSKVQPIWLPLPKSPSPCWMFIPSS